MYKLIVIAILMFIAGSLHGQSKRDFNYFNKLSYSQYLAEDWSGLIRTGRESIRSGFDSYYLRMRLGIALYSKKKYMLSEKQFRKALQFDNTNPSPVEYLHYAMLFTNREKEAITFYRLTKENKVRFFKDLYIETGYKVSDNKTSTGDIFYGLFSLRHGFSKRVGYYHAFQYLVRDYTSDISAIYGKGNRDNILQTKQFEYYGALEILAGKGFYITPAFHTQRITMEGYYWNNYVLSMLLSKHAGITNIYLSGSYSRIDQEYQYQGTLGLTLYPLANLDFYIDNQLTVQYESDDYHPSIKQKVGGRVLKKTWLEGWYSYGDLRYFNEQNAFIVFNTPNIMRYRIGGGMLQGIGKHTLYLNVIREYKQDYTTGVNYSHLDFILGINFHL